MQKISDILKAKLYKTYKLMKKKNVLVGIYIGGLLVFSNGHQANTSHVFSDSEKFTHLPVCTPESHKKA